MKIILLENITKLGSCGDIVTVKPGFARNFLLPKGAALEATPANLNVFKGRAAEFKRLDDKRKDEAKAIIAKLEKLQLTIAEEAKEAGMDEQIPDMVNLLCNDFGFNHVTEFMQLTPPRWLAEVLGEDSPLYASLSSMGHKYTGYFRYENADETITRFRHIATDRIIEATNRSLIGFPRNMKDPSLILRTGFIQWNGEWWLSGQTPPPTGSPPSMSSRSRARAG